MAIKALSKVFDTNFQFEWFKLILIHFEIDFRLVLCALVYRALFIVVFQRTQNGNPLNNVVVVINHT